MKVKILTKNKKRYHTQHHLTENLVIRSSARELWTGLLRGPSIEFGIEDSRSADPTAETKYSSHFDSEKRKNRVVLDALTHTRKKIEHHRLQLFIN